MIFGPSIHMYYLICLDSTARAWVVGLYEAMGNGGAAEALNLAAPVLNLASDAPGADPTVWSNTCVATEAQRQALEADEGSMPAGVKYVRVDNYTDPSQGLVEQMVRAANFAWGTGQIGNLFDWPSCLAALGLTQIQPAI